MEVNLQPYSNLLVKPIIHEQLENKKLLITTSPFSGENILHQTYEDKEYNLNIYPGGRSVRWTKVFTKNTTLPYRTSFTVSCYGYKSFNFIFRNESYTEVGFNEILVSYTIDSEVFTFKCPQNYGGFIGTLETTSQREITFKIVLDTYEQIGDVNSILQIGVAFTQPYTAYLKNIESQVVLKTYPVTSPHGLSVIKRNESDVFNYNESSPTEIQIIRLFQNHSDNNVIEKNIELIDVYEGYITYQGSILSPTINIKDSKVLQSNYLEFVTLGKFYYIEDIITLGKDSYQLSLKVDVLMTYKDDILKQGAYVLRNEFDYNNDVFDERKPIEIIPNIDIEESEESSPFLNIKQDTFYGRSLETSNTYCFTFSVCSTFTATKGEVEGFKQEYMSSDVQNMNTCNRTYIFKGSDLNQIYESIINDFSVISFFQNKSEYIYNFKFFPFDLNNYQIDCELTDTIWCGNSSLDITSEGISTKETYEVLRVNKPVVISLNGGSVSWKFPQEYTYLYKNLNCQLYIPFYGFVDIDFDMFRFVNNITIFLTYYVDIITGHTVVTLKNAYNKELFYVEFDISYDIPISNVDAISLKRNLLLTAIKGATAAATSGASLLVGGLNLNDDRARATKRTTPKTKLGRQIKREEREFAQEAFTSGVDLASTITMNFIKANETKCHLGSTLSNYTKYLLKNKPFLVVKYNNAIDDDNYNHYMGRPLNEYRSLNEIYGYTEVGAIHLDNLNNCLNYEKDEIEEYLKKGVYFPNKPQT